MRRFVIRLAAVASMVVALEGCGGDSPTAPNQPRDLSTTEAALLDNQTVQGCVRDGVCTLGPVSPAPGEPDTCDPYTSIDWCGDDGDCMSSGLGTDDPGIQGMLTCGEPWDSDGYKPPPATAPKPCPDYGCPPPISTYEQGPLAWGACVLAVLGSGYTIHQVAGAFQSWWDTQQEYESARRMLDAIQANPGSYTAETLSLWEFRVEYAEDRRDAAVDAVREKTGGTYWALAGAAVACGAAAFLPTP